MAGQTNHARTTLSMIHRFYLEEEYWDVQLLVNNRSFKCQRLLLAANSEYFHTMFTSKYFIESNPIPDQPIILHELEDATAFAEILHFMCTGKVLVNDSNVFQLLFLSDFLRLWNHHVEEKCHAYVTLRSSEAIPMTSAIDLFCFAGLKEESILADTLGVHIFKHLYHFSRDARLMEISLENLKALLVCGVDNILPSPGSYDILKAIIHNWVNSHHEERSQHRSKLMDSIDSSKVSSDFETKLAAFEMEMIDIGDIDSNARLSATITFNVKNISKLKVEVSPPCIISNLSWKTCVEREVDHVYFNLECEGPDLSLEWSCYASAIFTIRSPKKGNEYVIGKADCNIISPEWPNYYLGCNNYLRFHYLINRNGGFIEDDDSITLDTHVYSGVPCVE